MFISYPAFRPLCLLLLQVTVYIYCIHLQVGEVAERLGGTQGSASQSSGTIQEGKNMLSHLLQLTHLMPSHSRPHPSRGLGDLAQDDQLILVPVPLCSRLTALCPVFAGRGVVSAVCKESIILQQLVGRCRGRPYRPCQVQLPGRNQGEKEKGGRRERRGKIVIT